MFVTNFALALLHFSIYFKEAPFPLPTVSPDLRESLRSSLLPAKTLLRNKPPLEVQTYSSPLPVKKLFSGFNSPLDTNTTSSSARPACWPGPRAFSSGPVPCFFSGGTPQPPGLAPGASLLSHALPVGANLRMLPDSGVRVGCFPTRPVSG